MNRKHKFKEYFNQSKIFNRFNILIRNSYLFSPQILYSIILVLHLLYFNTFFLNSIYGRIRSYLCIGLHGKFLLIFKKNSNIAHLNLDIHLLNYIAGILFHNHPSFFNQLEYSILPELLRFFSKNLCNMIFQVDQRVKVFAIKGIL